MRGLRAAVFAALACAASGLIGFLIGEGGSESRPRVVVPGTQPEGEAALGLGSVDPQLAACPAGLSLCESGRSSLRSSVAELTRQNADLREDIEFYRGMLAAAGDEPVRLLKLEWYQLDQRRLMLRAVLVQPGNARSEVRGELRFRLRGSMGDQLREFPVRELVQGNPPSPQFAFRRLTEWEAELRLPQGFVPERLIATIQVQGGRSAIVKSWTWRELES